MTYTPRRTPWAHQAQALRSLEGRGAFALFMAMRTGKTKVILDDFGRLELTGDAQDLLVIAPAGVYQTWEKAIAEHLSVDLLGRTEVHTWVSSKKDPDLAGFLAGRTRRRIFLVNVEALSTVKAARTACANFLMARRSMLVVDESTCIKNYRAARTRFICGELAAKAHFRRILSGLPNPNSPLDLYSQFTFLDPDIMGCKSFFSFQARYAVVRRQKFGRQVVNMVVGYRNQEDLAQRIAPHSFRVRLQDCYDLPPKLWALREVQLTPQQAKLYSDMKTQAYAQLAEASFATATMVITQLLRLHQILCGHVPSDEGEAHEIPELRTAALVELLQEYDGKAIVWCSYDADVRKIKSALELEFGAGCCAQFWGGNASTREAEEKRFLEDPRCRFMVATPASGGRGRTWTVADLVVYYSNTHDLEHRSQSEERAQAIDRSSSVQYVDLVAPGTVDEKILAALKRKVRLSETILEGANWLD